MSFQSHQAPNTIETTYTETQLQNEESYKDLSLNHNKILTAFYDYYMEFEPQTVKKIFRLMFSLNKIFRLLLLYCLFYHTIWWLPNSTSKNLAINYSNIDPIIFIVLLYYNFFVIFNNFFLRTLFFPLLKSVFSVNRVRFLFDTFEIFIHILINLLVFCYLKNYLESDYVILIMSPHFFLIICKMFDISIILNNCELLTNRTGKHLN
jgi:hypothetical protein